MLVKMLSVKLMVNRGIVCTLHTRSVMRHIALLTSVILHRYLINDKWVSG